MPRLDLGDCTCPACNGWCTIDHETACPTCAGAGWLEEDGTAPKPMGEGVAVRYVNGFRQRWQDGRWV